MCADPNAPETHGKALRHLSCFPELFLWFEDSQILQQLFGFPSTSDVTIAVLAPILSSFSKSCFRYFSLKGFLQTYRIFSVFHFADTGFEFIHRLWISQTLNYYSFKTLKKTPKELLRD